MEEQSQQQGPLALEDLGLPNEMWAQILEHVYSDPTILNKADDIHEGIAAVKKYILNCSKTMPLVCKTFKALNITQSQWATFKEQLREFYITHLNEKFLEQHQGQEGLYPKNGEWHEGTTINNDTAAFLALGIMSNNTMVDVVYSNDTPHAHLKLITLLLFYGANADLQDDDGKTALYMTASNHHPANRNNSEIITLLLQYGANPNLQDESGKTPLYSAICNHHIIERNNIEIIILLLQHGANPNTKEKKDVLSAFSIALVNHYTIDRNNGEIIKILLQHGANHDRHNKHGIPPLCWSVQSHHSVKLNMHEIIIILLQYKANPNIQDIKGKTALMHAVYDNGPLESNNNNDIIRLLLQYGANPNVKDNQGKTAFDIAKEKDFNEFPHLVRKHSQNSLKKICLLHILTNLPQFEGQLNSLPAELQDSINNLKS